ncbi:hypothetical protein EWM64_g1815 [Hericium alpestre]|uniref:Uncharacterized protein n=1 Tax=Hericium alpestre TaxID=135208 RepID=A0A4Z0A7F0_9AGAM|nr:hypothetical protein EWM64_g1815 [Hericium alpestre]
MDVDMKTKEEVDDKLRVEKEKERDFDRERERDRERDRDRDVRDKRDSGRDRDRDRERDRDRRDSVRSRRGGGDHWEPEDARRNGDVRLCTHVPASLSHELTCRLLFM